MSDSNNVTLDCAVEKLKSYISANYSKKSRTDYFRILDGLEQYAIGDDRTTEEIISAYYQEITETVPFQRATSLWKRVKGRTIFMLLDILSGNKPKREYVYNKHIYSGAFVLQLASFEEWQQEIGNRESTIKSKSGCIRDFLSFLDKKEVAYIEQISVDHVLSYLQSRESASSNYRRYISRTLKSFLTSPTVRDKLSFDAATLLSGFRYKPNDRLKSFYTPEELRKVMNAIDRTTLWGKTIYAIMLLACVYGLRAGDIRELQMSSICWKSGKIQLIQNKTKIYIELPLTDNVKYALLDYLKNVRPASPDTHFFIRHRHPHIPYSNNGSFSSKVAVYFKEAKINTDHKHFGMHSLRFSLATELLAEGVPIHAIASVLGHKNIQTTKEYTWADMEHLRNAALEVPEYDGC